MTFLQIERTSAIATLIKQIRVWVNVDARHDKLAFYTLFGIKILIFGGKRGRCQLAFVGVQALFGNYSDSSD